MKKIYSVLILLFVYTQSFAQNNSSTSIKDDFAIGVSVFHTQFFNRNFYGFAFDAKCYVQPKWAFGFNVAFASKNVAQDFNFYVEQPTVNYAEFSFLTHFDIYKTQRFKFAFELSNGYGFANLTDRAYTEPSEDDLFEVPITIASNQYYVLQAGVETAVRLSKNYHGCDIYLKSDIKHRKTFGKANFGNSNDFKGFYVGLGVMIVGDFH